MKDLSKESAINIIFDTHFNRPFDMSYTVYNYKWDTQAR